MFINYRDQDVVYVDKTVYPHKTSEIVIIHGVNCQRVMGSGVAKSLYTRWPKVRSMYMTIPQKEMWLGAVQRVQVDQFMHVFNCWTQEYYGNDGKAYGNLDAIEASLLKVVAWAEENRWAPAIYMPRIGCGLAGLDWSDVEAIITGIKSTIEVVVCDI